MLTRELSDPGMKEFVVEVNNENESRAILTITQINGVEVEITECSNTNQSKGLLYICRAHLIYTNYIQIFFILPNDHIYIIWSSEF